MKLVVLLLIAATFICSLGAIKFLALADPDTSTSLTNVGFAMFIGLSSVLFNWARSLDSDRYQKEINGINQKATYSILGSVLFIMSSGLKYFSKSADGVNMFIKSTDRVLETTSFVLIMFAMICACFVINGIIINFYYINEKQ